MRPGRPLVIGHRGACGHRPEHTLASYALAARMGADVLEPDLVTTRDGVLVARHENLITDTTDVADRPQFAARRTTKVVDGLELTGWFTEDLTLAELKELRARERIPELRPGNARWNGCFEVPTLQEVIDLRARLDAELGRRIAIYPETKHPAWFRSLGLPLEEELLRVLSANGLDGSGAPVLLQSFEPSSLRRLAAAGVPLVQLLRPAGAPHDLAAAGDPTTYADLATPAGLRRVAGYAQGVGPAKEQVVPWSADGASGAPTSLVADAHQAGLVVHPYTFRGENAFLPLERRSSAVASAHGDLAAELAGFYALGVDGVFCDHPDVAVAAREARAKRSGENGARAMGGA